MPTKIPLGLNVSFQPPIHFYLTDKTQNIHGPYPVVYSFRLGYERGIVNNNHMKTPYTIYSRFSVCDKDGNDLDFIEPNG